MSNLSWYQSDEFLPIPNAHVVSLLLANDQLSGLVYFAPNLYGGTVLGIQYLPGCCEYDKEVYLLSQTLPDSLLHQCCQIKFDNNQPILYSIESKTLRTIEKRAVQLGFISCTKDEALEQRANKIIPTLTWNRIKSTYGKAYWEPIVQNWETKHLM